MSFFWYFNKIPQRLQSLCNFQKGREWLRTPIIYFFVLVIQLKEIFRMTLLEVLRSYLLSIDPICATNNTILFKQLPRYIKWNHFATSLDNCYKGTSFFVELCLLRELKFQEIQQFFLECSLFFHYLNIKENIQMSKFHQILKKISLFFGYYFD